VSPDTFKWVVGALLAAIVVFAIAPWDLFAGTGPARPLTGATPVPGPGPPDYPPDHTPPGYYQPAASTAVGMTHDWAVYAASVDRICAVSFNYAIGREAQTKQTALARDWSDARAESAVVRLWAQEDGRIHRATALLGPPPARPVLFARWRANVARRTDLFAEASRVAGEGSFDIESRILHRIDRLKARSDRIGQHFGLRICTSN
jgi:hypothetical protein